MNESNIKKMLPIYILDILKEESDSKHKLTQAKICKLIYEIYGEHFERKSISTTIDLLVDHGYNIVKTNNGCYLNEREFETCEIQFLIDSVFSNKTIDSKHTKDLAKKISSFSNKYQRKNYDYIYKSDEIVKTNNKSIFYNIDVITYAIENNKQIEFNYNRFSLNGKENKRRHIVNPYYLISNQGKYYLVCNYFFMNKIANCRVDKIKNIKIHEGYPRKPITEIPEFKDGFDISKYVNERIYMFASGDIINATLKVNSEIALDYIDEYFGSNAHYFKEDNYYIVRLKVNENDLLYWLMQYYEGIELVKPLSTREKIKTMINEMAEKYK